MTSLYNFKKICIVPQSKDFVDFTLSRTNRKTPTVIHKNYQIGRIRAFYVRKIKFTQQNFHERLTSIIDEFPKLNDIHPFYADLINVLYDKDHYKLALGQINTARTLIANVGRDYVRFIKYADSLYRCKTLKKAALGRMVTIIKKQQSSLQYLEQVRQHLSRLPSVDPNTRTILICGFPNVGKSSFINSITKVDAEVQPYAFTTKSLYVGHTDYKYLRWQVIDTPGILDHPLEERNTIEMQAITALAHLKAIVLFVLDISELCNYTIEQQLSLFGNIKPLFANKPLMMAYNKIDVVKPEDLAENKREAIWEFQRENACLISEMSTLTGEGVMDVRNRACDALLAYRVENKLSNQKKADDILSRLHVAQPEKRDNIERPAMEMPEKILETRVNRGKEDYEPPRKTLRQQEVDEGDDFFLDLRAEWVGIKEKERYDPIPQIYNGKNIADWVDPDIKKKLKALKEEEKQREAAGFYKPLPLESDETKEVRRIAELVCVEKAVKISKGQMKSGKSRSSGVMPRTSRKRTLSIAQDAANDEGWDKIPLERISRSKTRLVSSDVQRGHFEPKRGSSRKERSESAKSRAISAGTLRPSGSVQSRAMSRSSSKPPRDRSGVRDESMYQKVKKIEKMVQRPRSREARKGDSDRFIPDKRPKHLFAGKRKQGSASHR